MEEDKFTNEYKYRPSHHLRPYQHHRRTQAYQFDNGSQSQLLKKETLKRTHPFLENLINTTSIHDDEKTAFASSNSSTNFISGSNSCDQNVIHVRKNNCIRGMVAVKNHLRGMVAVKDDDEKCYLNDKDHSNKDHTIVRGMTAIENDGDHNSPSVNNNNIHLDIYDNYAPISSTKDSNSKTSRLLEEVNDLFHDYERRFYRQSLTERAKELLDRARKTNTFTSDVIGNREKLALCTEALKLCRQANRDQEEALHGNDHNHVGGSYLVTGDIRIRYKGELLAAKIYCVRASVLYRTGEYSDCLEDCDAAIAIWNQHEQRCSSTSSRAFGVFKRRTSSVRTMQRNKMLSSDRCSSPRSAQIKPNSMLSKGKLSHKHLYILRGRTLAAMGRYKEATGWLTHPNELPVRKFHGTSQLLQNDGVMFSVIDQIACRDRRELDTEQHLQHQNSDQNAVVETIPVFPTKKQEQNRVIVPTNKKLWAHLLHSIDQRLTRGTVRSDGCLTTTSPSCISDKTTGSSNAIYQMLRYGPALFHHFEEEPKLLTTATTKLGGGE